MVSKNLIINSNFFAIVIIGPTASGKTSLAHNIADSLKQNGVETELVNLDAFQIYREISAGTAKPNTDEINKYKYHCLDIIEPSEYLDANSFANIVLNTCNNIILKKKVPICVGGSGLYLRAFLHGLDDLPPRDEKFRNQIRKIAEDKGWAWCHQLLNNVDPVRASELHPNDKTRIERALEIYNSLGKPMSSLRTKVNALGEQQTLFPCYIIHMEPTSSFLKERIKNRIPLLFNLGWLNEVQHLYEKYGDKLKSFNAMKAIGYNEVLEYIINNPNDTTELPALHFLYEKIETLTWQYAKRQSTWNSKEKKDFSIKHYHSTEYNDLFNEILKKIPFHS